MNFNSINTAIAGIVMVLMGSSFLSPEMKKRPLRLSPSELIRWVEGNSSGLRARSSSGDLEFGLLYRPHDYIVLKESLLKDAQLTKKELNLRRKEIEGMEYYTFSIARLNGKKDLLKSLTEDNEEYDLLLRYFSGEMQKDLKLVAGTDTIECTLFHFERTYGITSYARFVLGFEHSINKKNKRSDRTLLYYSRVSEKKLIELHLRKEDIHEIPKVIFKD